MKLSGRTVIPVVMGTLILLFVLRVHAVLLPFVLAAVHAYLFNPLIRFFEVRGIRRGPVVVFFYIALSLLVCSGAYYGVVMTAAEAKEAAQKMPLYVERGEHYLADLQRAARQPALATPAVRAVMDIPVLGHCLVNEGFLSTIAAHGRSWPQDILSRMPSYASGMLPFVELVILVPFISFFFMREGSAMRDAMMGWIPSRYVEMALNILVEIDNSLGKYVRGITLEAFCVGALAFVGFLSIGLDYAFQIALIVGLANIVPYVGPIVGVVLGGGVAIFQWGDVAHVVPVLLVCVAVRFIEDWFIQPVVLRHAVRLHPVFIVFSLMAGAQLFGFWGLLFGVPIACMVKVLLQVVWSWYVSQYGIRTPLPMRDVSRIPLI